METAKVAGSIAGSKPYQERARRALPLLVRQAHAGTPIYYSDLASELNMPNPRNLNYVLGSIGQALEALSKAWKEKVPPIQCLAINKHTGLPGEGIGWFITEKGDFRNLSRKQQRLLVEAELQKVFAYPKWHAVLSAFELSPVQADFTALVRKVAQFRASGESPEHKELKEFVAKHPEVVGLPVSGSTGETEFSLPSGDTIDVLFQHHDDCSYGTLPHLSPSALANQAVPLGPILGAPLGRGADRLGRAAEHRREGAALNPPHHDMVQGAGRRSRAKSGTEGSGRRAEGVEARLARRGDGRRTTEIVQMQRPVSRPVSRVPAEGSGRRGEGVEARLAGHGDGERTTEHRSSGCNVPHSVPVPQSVPHSVPHSSHYTSPIMCQRCPVS